MIEQRRFPRIHFKKRPEVTEKLEQAFVHWRNLETSDVFDLSIGGVAVSKPAMLEFFADDLLDFTLELGSFPALSVVAKVAWVGDLSVGLSFVRLEAEGHLILRKFINERVVGSHLRLMNKEFHAKDADFDFWYTGPGETHLFLKMADSSRLEAGLAKAEVILDGDTFVWNGGVITEGGSLKTRLLRILESAPEEHAPLAVFLRALKG